MQRHGCKLLAWHLEYMPHLCYSWGFLLGFGNMENPLRAEANCPYLAMYALIKCCIRYTALALDCMCQCRFLATNTTGAY